MTMLSEEPEPLLDGFAVTGTSLLYCDADATCGLRATKTEAKRRDFKSKIIIPGRSVGGARKP
jgi:hypothetical protein